MKRKRWRPFRPPVITRRALAAEGWPEILDREIAELDATERRMERLGLSESRGPETEVRNTEDTP